MSAEEGGLPQEQGPESGAIQALEAELGHSYRRADEITLELERLASDINRKARDSKSVRDKIKDLEMALEVLRRYDEK